MQDNNYTNLPDVLPSSLLGQAGDVLSDDPGVIVSGVDAWVDEVGSVDLRLDAALRL